MAFDEAIRQEMLTFLPRLRRFAYGLTGSLDRGDDLMQATVERALNNLDKWQAGTRLDSWLFRIARNLHLNELRDRATRERYHQAAGEEIPTSSDGSAAAEAQITLAAVRRFLARLPEEQRTILLLVCVDGLSYREVADTLELPIGTVTSRLARARLVLRTLTDGQPLQPLQEGGAD